MIEIKYKCSNGNEYNLIGDRMRVTDGNFHKYSWNKNVVESKKGDIVKNFAKGSVTYSAVLSFRGKLEERKKLLNQLRDDFERDIEEMKPGKLLFGNYYIEGYIVESETKVSEIKNNWSQDTIQIYCPSGTWIREETRHFYHTSETEVAEGIDFPFDFPFGFAKSNTGAEKWNIDHCTSSNFKMTIYGPCVDPRILINGYPRQVFTSLEANEYLVIDSRDSTVIKHLANGTAVSVYNSRQFQPSIFEKIPSGLLGIGWSGAFGFDITLYIERSEPKW